MSTIRPFYDDLNKLYQTVLGRPIDHSGYFAYASLLERGEKTLEDVERILRNSQEHKDHEAGSREER